MPLKAWTSQNCVFTASLPTTQHASVNLTENKINRHGQMAAGSRKLGRQPPVDCSPRARFARWSTMRDGCGGAGAATSTGRNGLRRSNTRTPAFRWAAKIGSAATKLAGAEYIRAPDEPAVHLDRRIAVDAHAVADFGAGLQCRAVAGGSRHARFTFER